MAAKPDMSEPVIIKKYANRRLYNTESSSYVTLDNLAELVRQGRDFIVRDAKSGEDITRSVLTQIIFEQESKGHTLLPVPFLRDLISLYGDGLQAMVPSYLQTSMQAFLRNQEQFREAMQSSMGLGGFDEMVRQNMALMEKGKAMFTPFHGDKHATRDESQRINELERQLGEMQARLDRMSAKGKE